MICSSEVIIGADQSETEDGEDDVSGKLEGPEARQQMAIWNVNYQKVHCSSPNSAPARAGECRLWGQACLILKPQDNLISLCEDKCKCLRIYILQVLMTY